MPVQDDLRVIRSSLNRLRRLEEVRGGSTRSSRDAISALSRIESGLNHRDEVIERALRSVRHTELQLSATGIPDSRAMRDFLEASQ